MFSSWTFLCSLTQQEQVIAQSQGGWLSPAGGGVGSGVGGLGIVGGGNSDRGGGGGGGGEEKGIDIIQMLTKARTEYDKVGKVRKQLLKYLKANKRLDIRHTQKHIRNQQPITFKE